MQAQISREEKILYSVCLHGHKCWAPQTSGLILTLNPEGRRPRWQGEVARQESFKHFRVSWATVHIFHNDHCTAWVKNSSKINKNPRIIPSPKYTSVLLSSVQWCYLIITVPISRVNLHQCFSNGKVPSPSSKPFFLHQHQELSSVFIPALMFRHELRLAHSFFPLLLLQYGKR